MLPKKRRVQRLLFKSILSKNRSFRSDNLLLIVEKTDTVNKTRFSFVISKKVEKKATKRNLFKRIGLGVLKDELKNIKDGFICVFFIKKNIQTVKYSNFALDILSLLKKAGILKD